MLFQVLPKGDIEYSPVIDTIPVYDVSYDSNGYPMFLIYQHGQWLRKSAKHFRPTRLPL